MKLFKKKVIEKEKVIICFHGFSILDNQFLFLQDEFIDYDFKFPNLYEMFVDDFDDMYIWAKNVKDYLYSMSEKYVEIILVGYELGGLLAGISADLTFITKIIIISPSYYYISIGSGKLATTSLINDEDLKLRKISPNRFQIIHTIYLKLFEVNANFYAAKILFLQGMSNNNMDNLHNRKLFDLITAKSKHMVCIGCTTNKLLDDKNSLVIIPMISRLFVENKISIEE